MDLELQEQASWLSACTRLLEWDGQAVHELTIVVAVDSKAKVLAKQAKQLSPDLK
jgi:hypothetical protein